MKQFATLCLISCLFTTAFGQTKQQTIDWLNSKFPNDYIGYEDNLGEYQVTAKIDKEGNFKQYSKVYKNNSVLRFTHFGSFKKLNASTAKIKKEGDYFFIALFCSSDEECITQEEHNGTFNLIELGPYKMSETDLDKRLLKAFKHLIILCGGKGSSKEAF